MDTKEFKMKLDIIQVNIHKHKQMFGYESKWIKENQLYIYCGRSKNDNPNSLGNPFPVNDKRNLTTSINLFRNYFLRDQISLSQKFNDYIFEMIKTNKLTKLYLGCFCKPKDCHTDVIKEELTKSLRKKGVIC